VAVTRAKALLIVVGNPVLLESDHNWCYLLRHIYTNGGYTGCKYVHDVNKPLPLAEDHGDRDRSQILNNFQKLLDKSKQILSDLNEAENGSKFATNTSIKELMQQMKNLAFFTGMLVKLKFSFYLVYIDYFYFFRRYKFPGEICLSVHPYV